MNQVNAQVSHRATEEKVIYHHGREEFPIDPRYERLVAMIVGLASQVSVLSERLITLEKVVERKGVLTREDLENHSPTEEELAKRTRFRTHLIETVFRCVEQDLALFAGKA